MPRYDPIVDLVTADDQTARWYQPTTGEWYREYLGTLQAPPTADGEPLTYKPGWRVDADVVVGRHAVRHVPGVRIRATLPDSYHRDRVIPVDFTTPIFGLAGPDGPGPLMTVRNALYGVLVVEIHEAMEWLKGPNGRPVFDPHDCTDGHLGCGTEQALREAVRSVLLAR